MKDKLVMENLLLLLKGTCEVYVHGTQESSNKEIHEALKEGLDELLKMQFEVYNEMTKYGWYKIENIKTQEVKKTLQKLQNKEA